jgi:hypothetical protein
LGCAGWLRSRHSWTLYGVSSGITRAGDANGPALCNFVISARPLGEGLVHRVTGCHVVYRCYLIRNGRIESGYDIYSERLSDAVAQGQAIIMMQAQPASFSGIEIWCGESRVYGDDCYADDTGHLTPIISPFQTDESTMFFSTRFMFNGELASLGAGPHRRGQGFDS